MTQQQNDAARPEACPAEQALGVLFREATMQIMAEYPDIDDGTLVGLVTDRLVHQVTGRAVLS